MKNDSSALVGKIAELHGRSTAITARIGQDAQLLTETHREMAIALNDLWQLLQQPRPPVASLPEPPHILRVAEVAKRVGLARSSIWQMVKDGRFPAPRRLSQRAVGWHSADIESWLTSRQALKPQGEPGRRGPGSGWRR